MAELADRLTAALADRYRLLRQLGAGGMATVWLAEDLRHDRQVAIKVLHPELSAVLGPERFLAEIKLTAALQHPHILPLFDSGSADGLLYYVMPFVDGETLRTRLSRERQLPVALAVHLATEVADALSVAHAKGVVHRDIKPENILLQNGHALVADFGIALAVQQASSARMTQTGLSLGTPEYMSPEQAMGERTIDARTDVYALGVVLHEMLSGEPPFTGPNAQAIVSKVLTEAPRQVSVLRPSVPPNVSAAVATALQKLPADRFSSAAEFAAALGNPGFAGAGGTTATLSPKAHAQGLRDRMVLALGAVSVVAIGLAAWALLRAAPAGPIQRYDLAFAAGQGPPEGTAFVLAPDGSALLYRGPGPGGSQIWRKARDRWESVPIDGTTNAASFAISPDGQSIVIVQDRKLRRLQITGGAAETLVDADVAGNPAWLDDGTIVYSTTNRQIARVPSGGGAPRFVWTDTMTSLGALRPLPGSRGVLANHCRWPCDGNYSLQVLDLGRGVLRPVYAGGVLGFYVRTGHVAIVRPDGAMLAVPFDPGALAVRGPAVPIRDSVVVLDGRQAHIAYADDGTLIVRSGSATSTAPVYRLVWIDRHGRESAVDTGWTFRSVLFGSNAGWSLSPDGTRLALGVNTSSGDDIWVKQLPRGPAVRVTFDSLPDFRPRWMPDGRTLLFSSTRAPSGLYRRPADGTGRDSLVLAGAIFEGQISRDGRWIVARAGGTVALTGGRDIGVVRVGTDSALAPLIATRFDESEIALSPDGRWIAYVSDETGRPEVYLRPFPDVNRARWQVSPVGGVAPLWSRDGRELFFLDPARTMTVVTVQGPADARIGEPQPLFHLDDAIYPAPTVREYYTPYDISPDGTRFIMARAVRTPMTEARSQLQVTLHWDEELRERMRQKR